MYQRILPGFDMQDMEVPPRKKRHVFISIMSDIGHLSVLSSERLTSTAWDRLAKQRANHPTIFDQVVDTLDSF